MRRINSFLIELAIVIRFNKEKLGTTKNAVIA